MKNIWYGIGIAVGAYVLLTSLFGGSSVETAPNITSPSTQHSVITPVIETPRATTPPVKQAPSTNGLSNNNYYTNSAGNEVHSPAYSNKVPSGATAICEDGTYSFSQSRRGTCSHHGGVAVWL